ncbi:LacI family DNA-binding transcriptional regulator [Sediminispirochaeta bajacaliforniensis]|uniref:LacI family DNA-binding transcriptional regulator n=1 Tax=Sediminispirochaeta bajacaliforniensis TaxID=148 RepID=UPI0003810FDA|nr:LacI family DNA-binding transcriptional regulator [Sediminispirochaeta bajacaliforniensis]
MEDSQVTIKDIAKIAGVSFSTVSRSLNNSPLVAEKTRRRISEIADELGFEFNASARGLITKQVGTVGIILPDQYTEVAVNVYHGMLMNSLRTILEKKDVDLIVSYEKNHFTGKNNIVRLVTRNKVDGLIILVETIQKETLDFLESKNIPFVCTHYPPIEILKDQDVVYTDHLAGGRMIAEYFLESGRNSFLILAQDIDPLEFKMREDGFRDTVERAGKPVKRLTCKKGFDTAYLAVKHSPDLLDGVDALFAMNDIMALGAMKGLKELGFRIPEDIAVVGYDDIDFAKYSDPPLSSIHQPREELAVLSCERLFFQMEKQKSGMPMMKKRITIQPVLIVRESS